MAGSCIELQLAVRCWVRPSLIALAWLCAGLSLVMPHRWIERIADVAVAIVARFGLRIDVVGYPKNG